MVCFQDPLIQKLYSFYHQISKLDNLAPSEPVNALMTSLVHACIPPHPVDISNLCPEIQDMRSNLISLAGHAEALMEKHYSKFLGAFPAPLDHFDLFPYYSNYLNLSRLEFDLLIPQFSSVEDIRRVAFVGSGPLPLSSIVMASQHLTSAVIDNFDLDASANALASKLVESDPELSGRMRFVTKDIMEVSKDVLKEYDVVFLAALVGMDLEQKVQVIEHLAKNMAPGAILMVRSAHGARAFLYPVVEPRHLRGFEVLQIYHPTDDVINSVIVTRKCRHTVSTAIDRDQGIGKQMTMIHCKCGGIDPSFKPRVLIQELGMGGHHCS